jgi:copper chaperone NosL
MNKMSFPSRIIIAIASLVLAATYFLPVWFIYLIAPQYPEGLTMNIWLYKITGQVEIINGLNHYIGMKHIKVEMFPEFKFLIYVLIFFILFGLAVAIIGKRKLLFAYLLTTISGGIAAMVDFYRWGYDYGHNLDPKAAIQIPGLSYQPPLIGHKTLLNFDAYSYPDIGGWVIIGAGSIFFLVWFYEWFKNRKREASVTKLKTAVPIAAARSPHS